MTAKLLPAYIAVGADELKRRQSVARIKHYVAPENMQLNFTELDASSKLSLQEVSSAINQLSLLGGQKVVVVHNAEKLGKDIAEVIIKYLSNPNDEETLLLDCVSLAKNTRLYKAVANIDAKSIIDCSPKKTYQLPEYISELAKTHEITIDINAAQTLVDRVGEDTMLLNNALEKLKTLYGTGARISKVQVEQGIAQTNGATPWKIADAICRRNATQAIALFNTFDSSKYIYLHSVICARIRELICAKDNPYGLSAELGGPSWKYKNHASWAANFKASELRSALKEAAQVEAALKGSTDSKTAFVKWILQISSM